LICGSVATRSRTHVPRVSIHLPTSQTRDQTSAFHGGNVQSSPAGLLVSPIRIRTR
jgi:hypothetical protein